MVQHRSILTAADNTGARGLRIALIFGGSRRKFGTLGDIVNCVVTDADPNGVVKKGEIVKAVIVRVKKEYRRKDGSYIRFDDNAAVTIDNPKDKNPKGTRIFGPIARELKDLGFNKIISLAPEVL
jgi:large subunit ribosomal protein L14